MLFFLTRPFDCGTGCHHLSDPHPVVAHYASVPSQVSKTNIQYDIFYCEQQKDSIESTFE